jgi:rubrerythrin
MSEPNTLEILKQAILLERRGKAFYQKVAEQADSDAIQSFFQDMAEEEQKHIEILSAQFKSYTEEGRFSPGGFNEEENSRISDTVLNADIKEKIATAGFEAAAIGAAISMEERAVKVYSEQGVAAVDPEEKRLYTWLSQWERQHLKVLMDIDRALVEKSWHDNQFWPF